AVVSSIAMFVGSQFGQKTTPDMIVMMDRASGKNARISPKLEKANCKTLATEGKAVSNHILSTDYMQARGFSLS
ncbi:MAG: hypothetical protein RRY25_05855, partial [Anaerovorax sp.]